MRISRNEMVIGAALFAAVLGGCAAKDNGNSNNNGAGGASLTGCTAGSTLVGRVQGGELAQLPNGTRRLGGEVPETVGRDTDQGLLAEKTELPVTVVLSLSNEEGLKHDLAALYDPLSPNYRRFLKKGEFRALYGPGEKQIAEVRQYLEAKGLHSVTVDPSGLSVHAVGTAAALNTAFHTEVHRFATAKGMQYHAPSLELSVPAGLPIQGVFGLSSLMVAHSHAVLGTVFGGEAKPATGTGPSGGLGPVDIRKAYNLPANLDGSGETIALFELDGYTASDITAYEQQFGLPNVPLTNILVGNASGAADGNGAGEVTLDIELAIAAAPRAAKIVVYEGENNEQGMLDTLGRIANDNLARQVSTSWGTPEANVTNSFLQSENTIFMQMAAQGQTFYAAAGDAGAYDDGTNLGIDDPSGQPYVVSVGGTTLKTDSSGAYASETTWNESAGGGTPSSGHQTTGAGGGGISAAWTIPSWQKGVTPAQGSATMRNVPDVALQSDIATGYAVYFNGSWIRVGGTSCASPLWAAFTALVNQNRSSQKLGALGYVTPALYALGRSARYHDDFHDIADGSTNKYYSADPGYDDATGWGSFNAANLSIDLSQPIPGGTNAASVLHNSCSGV